jgi:acyl-CoA thioester hydrolase
MTTSSAAPFISDPIAIEAAWIDYNGHLNQAYYGVIFDRALDALLAPSGLDADTIKARGVTYMTAETHYCYLREVLQSDPVRVALRVLDCDDKRLHVFCELRHATDDWLACTSEWMFLSVSLETRRVAPWPTDVRARLEAMRAASAGGGRPIQAGRRIAIVRKD